MKDIKGKQVTVMGLGLHGGGLSVSRWLLKHGARVLVTDLKSEKELRPSVAALRRYARSKKTSRSLTLVLGRHQKKDFIHADMIIQNPGVPRTSPYVRAAKKHFVPVFNEASLFFSLCRVPIIGITGSKGKSTTTALAGALLKKKYPTTIVAGNIGTTAMFDVIDRVREDSSVPYVVLELSSWHLEGLKSIKKSPHIALVTTIAPDHLNRYSSMDAYVSAKRLIVQYQQKGDAAVMSRKNELSRSIAGNYRGEALWFSQAPFRGKGAYIHKGTVYWQEGDRKKSLLRLSDIPLPGAHNIDNVLAAVTLAAYLGVAGQHIRAAVRNFHGLPGRMEYVGNIQGRKVYNDTTATAPHATEAALKSLGGRIVLIGGGADKKLPLGGLVRIVKKKVAYLVLLPGSGTSRLAPKLRAKGYHDFSVVSSLRDAVVEAYAHSKKGDTIVLSPAFASFGIFAHEFDRGRKFVKEIKRWGKKT